MFEFSIAFKYLVPRWRQLSVSIISLISIFVIALVVWLILVFFSVSNGLEKGWIDKITTLTAPLRILPTEAYADSYYYKIDSLSERSDYTSKSIQQKRESTETDPYDPSVDQALPPGWVSNGAAKGKDLVKEVFAILENPKLKETFHLSATPFEMAFSALHLRLVREDHSKSAKGSASLGVTTLDQNVYLSSYDATHLDLQKTLLPLRGIDIQNLLQALSIPKKGNEEMSEIVHVSPSQFQKHAQSLLKHVTIKSLKTSSYGGQIPVQGEIFLRNLEMDEVTAVQEFADTQDPPPFWWHLIKKERRGVLPVSEDMGHGVLLPRSFREGGVRLGDFGFLSYYAPTASSVQEQRIPIYVAGFFDHGIMPLGGKLVMVTSDITSLIRSQYDQSPHDGTTGIYVRFNGIDQAEKVKEALQKEFRQRGIEPYWKVETYREYDFTKDLLQQLQSEKHLFMLISILIVLVACSNIISMLIILVNDKKNEIGILRAMGATSTHIATIFGLCGFLMGMAGSLLGIGLALLTLARLDTLIGWMSRLQGHEMFNAAFFGTSLPNQLSGEALAFVLATTVGLSLLAGIIPAVKASLLRPAAILRAE